MHYTVLVVKTKEMCEEGAAKLGWSATSASVVETEGFPPGCFRCETPACDSHGLYTNNNLGSTHAGNSGWTGMCHKTSHSSTISKTTSDLQHCQIVPNNKYIYKGINLDGKELCCPAGWIKSGDGSLCDSTVLKVACRGSPVSRAQLYVLAAALLLIKPRRARSV